MTGPVQEQIDHYWDQRARTYHAHQQRGDRDEIDRRLWGGIWSGVLPKPPADVLDLGTGSGHAAFVMAGLGHRVTGLDASTEMLRIARERARSAKGAAPTFVHGDAVAPEAAEGGFDAVTSRYLMWTLRDPVAALRRWRRLLRPGGVLALVDATWFEEGLAGSPEEFIDSYEGLLGDLPLATADSMAATEEVVRAAGYREVRTRPLHEVLETDLRLGAAPGHRPRLQHLVTARP